MKQRIAPLEAISWTVLLLAALLFGTAIAYAGEPKKDQRKKKEDKHEGKAVISICKEDNGKVIRLDTTINLADEAAIEAALKKLELGDDFHFDLRMPGEHGKEDAFTMKFWSEDLSPDDRKRMKDELAAAMRDSERSLEDAHKAMKEFHMEIKGMDEEGSGALSMHFPADFDFEFPEHFRCGVGDPELDSLQSDDRILIIGKPDEAAPVFEKTVTTASGKQVFVYQRQLSQEAQRSRAAEKQLDIRDIEIFPNPADDRLTLSFEKEKTGDITIRLMDLQGKVVYDETLRAFSGAYYKRIDISGIAAGTYTLSMEQGESRITRKVIIR